jgi:iduronate 2-sulfatase
MNTKPHILNQMGAIGSSILVASTLRGAEPALKPKNILLLCIDDLRPELRCFDAEYIHSPNIDRLAANGRAFRKHYVQAPSCGPSRYALLTGLYGPYGNDALFERARKVAANPDGVPPSMPEWFRNHGYTTVSVGKVSHHPGGRGGKNWNEDAILEVPKAWDRHLMPVAEWETPRGAMHGLANGQVRDGATDGFPVFESYDGPDDSYPDGHITEEGIKQLAILARDDKPFFLAIGLIKPHLPFGAPKAYMQHYEGKPLPPIPHPAKPDWKSTYHGSGEFMRYKSWGKDPNSDAEFADAVRRHYAACVSYADAQVGKILAELKSTGRDKDTVIVLWGDHGWHLGEYGVWGKHTLFEESLRAPLIIAYPGMGNAGKAANGVVETIDIFPTLCALTGTPVPDYAMGTSLLPQLVDPVSPGHTALAYMGSTATIRTDDYRLIKHADGTDELYRFTPDGTVERLQPEENQSQISAMAALLKQRMRIRGENPLL